MRSSEIADPSGIEEESPQQDEANTESDVEDILQATSNLHLGKYDDRRKRNLPEPRYDYFCVVDFECTCDIVNTKPHEIIEFPAIFLNARTLNVDFEFHRYVRPTEAGKLTVFCKELTGISQELVDDAEPLRIALNAFDDFCASKGLIASARPSQGKRTFCIATDGPWDVCKFLEPECQRKRILGIGPTWRRVVNIRSLFKDHFSLERGGVSTMLSRVGLRFEGREHSGIDDSRNIARLLAILLADGVNIRHNIETRFGISQF